MVQTSQARKLHTADPSGAHSGLTGRTRRFREASDGGLFRAGKAGAVGPRGSAVSGADPVRSVPAVGAGPHGFAALACALLVSACASAPPGYSGGVVVAPVATCDRLMSEAQVWLVRNGAANGVTGIQTATAAVVQTARPVSDTSAEVFVDVTRSNGADGTCRIDVSANSWNPFSVSRALRIEDALAKHLRAVAAQ